MVSLKSFFHRTRHTPVSCELPKSSVADGDRNIQPAWVLLRQYAEPDKLKPEESPTSILEDTGSALIADRVESRCKQTSDQEKRPVILLYSNCQADEFTRLLSRVEAFNSNFELRYMFIHDLATEDRGWNAYPKSYLDDVSLVWEQVSQAYPSEREELNRRLPGNVRRIRFPAISTSSIWPFAIQDPRLDRYKTWLYSDSLASSLAKQIANEAVSDDEIFSQYMESSSKRLHSLDRRLEMDIDQWRSRDAECDVRVSAFLEKHILDTRLFWMAGRVTSEVQALILDQLLVETFANSHETLSQIRLALSQLFKGYVGKDNISVPVNPIVAERLDLKWFEPNATYQWLAHEWTFRQWVVHCVRFSPYVQDLY